MDYTLTATERAIAGRALAPHEIDAYFEQKWREGGAPLIGATLTEFAKLPAPDYRARRAAAYKRELAKVPTDAGSFERVVGDVLDVLITQVEAMRVSLAANRTPEFEALLGNIAAIKAAHPKP
ncbi:MAG: hypothetical protein FJX65_11380 [Alphaproteobacteria bacterium]|nr:hypothetical protein [Alphaproteobacteria bacterium]